MLVRNFAVLWFTATLATTIAEAQPLDPKNRDSVVNHYYEEYLGSASGGSGWNGNVASCQAGSVSSAYLDAGLRRINYFRAMVSLPPVAALDPVRSAKCQEAALMMTANGALSHSPPGTWDCYTANGAEAAGKSNLALGYSSLATAITAWILDNGVTSAGHRRWILHPPLAGGGLGAVTAGPAGYAMWVIGVSGSRPAQPEYVAWPPEGYVPFDLLPTLWSFSCNGASFSGTGVGVTRDGSPLATTLETVQNGYGDNTLVWRVQGAGSGSPGQDEAYQVTLSNVVVSGTPRTFVYTVTVIDPAVVATIPATWGSLKTRYGP